MGSGTRLGSAVGVSFQYQDGRLVRSLCDKSQMQELARRSGVATAQSVVPRSKEDVACIVETATFPVMVKAIDAERLRSRTGGQIRNPVWP